MQDFVSSTGFIFAFLIGTLFVGMVLGEKGQRWFLILVLASMVISNRDKFTAFLNKI